nr:AraC family ligand binding domain-containing protein [Butyrivibrio sp.]
MEKAYKLEFTEDEFNDLYVYCCGISRTLPKHFFGPAIKPHYMIHYIISGSGLFSFGGKDYPLSAGYGFLIVPEELAFYESDESDPWTYVWVGFGGKRAEEIVAQ